MACLYFDPKSKPSWEELRANAFFVKLDAKDQMVRLGRSGSKSTLEWWNKQCEIVRNKSLVVKPDDVKIEDGIELMREYANKHDPEGKSWVWARGNLDQLVLDSMEEKLEIEPVFFYSRWRDVRTAIDLLAGSINGYCHVDYPGFYPSGHIIKHDPVDDCVYDAMMLLYGKEKVE
jgi:hypothetical protein